MTNIDFAALPDAEAARLMAEMDGLSPQPYTTSLDAAVGWLGRMGVQWCRTIEWESEGTNFYISAWTNNLLDAAECVESPDIPTARALCNAGWAAVQAREAK